jgi:hypothetical protein
MHIGPLQNNTWTIVWALAYRKWSPADITSSSASAFCDQFGDLGTTMDCEENISVWIFTPQITDCISTMSTRYIEIFWLKHFKLLKIASNYGWSCWRVGMLPCLWSGLRASYLTFWSPEAHCTLVRSQVDYMDLYPSIWLSDLPEELGNQVVEVVFLLA